MKNRLYIEEWLVEPQLGTISSGDRSVRLEPRSMEVLMVLTGRAGEVLGKQELIEEVWRQRFVSDEVLTHAVWELRKAFEDDARRPRYIQTIPKKGYRLIATVTAAEAEAGESRPSKRRWLVPVTLAAILTAAGLGIAMRSSTPVHRTAPNAKRLLVLPLDDRGSGERPPIAVGLTEALTRRLSDLRGLSVVARSVAEQYDGERHARIRADLGVEYVLEGTVLWFVGPEKKSRVRIALELISTTDASQLWAQSFDREIEDPFSMLPEVAKEIADQLAPELGLSSFQVAANQAYLTGLAYKTQPTYELEDMIRAIKLFELCLERDPEFVAAWAELSMSHSRLAFNGDSLALRLGKAEEALRRGRLIRSDDPSLQIAAAFLEYHGRREFRSARRQFEQLAEAFPRRADVLRGLGLILRRTGELELAIQHLKQAFDLEPTAELAGSIAETYRALRRWAEAQKYYDLALDLAPDSPVTWGDSAINLLDLTGSVSKAHNRLASFPADPRGEPWLLYYWLPLDLYAGDFHGAIGRYRDWPQPRPDDVICKIENPWHIAIAEHKQEHHERALDLMQENRHFLEKLVSRDPEFGLYHAYLARVYAFLGMREPARDSIAKAMELFGDDEFSGPRTRQFEAEVLTLLGERDKAIEVLRELMTTPYQRPLSLVRLLKDPIWEPLHDQPGFASITEVEQALEPASVGPESR